jgi:hypothetical protein
MGFGRDEVGDSASLRAVDRILHDRRRSRAIPSLAPTGQEITPQAPPAQGIVQQHDGVRPACASPTRRRKGVRSLLDELFLPF